jgi:glycine cleavage system H protein
MAETTPLRFSSDHLYVRLTGQEAVIGFTQFGQDHTSRVTTIELPAVGQSFKRGELFGGIEAIKAVIELTMPVSGTVLAVNEDLRTNPWRVNTDPYGEGWLLRVRLVDADELDDLQDEATYRATATWAPRER